MFEPLLILGLAVFAFGLRTFEHPVLRKLGGITVLRGAVSRATASLAGERPRGLRGDAEVVAVAGTATTLAALELRLDPYVPAAVEGFPIERELLRRWIANLSQMSVEERRRLPGLEPGRADVIVTGLLILDGVLARLGVERFRVSGRGVRYGVAFRLLEGKSLV